MTLLPFARGLATGQCFYFRDLSRQFFPLRRFAVDGLLNGELRHWNPLLHEGEPLSLPPLSYPLDLLQLFLRDEAGFSLLLALHVPLGALAFVGLARGLGVSLPAAAGGAIAYALGGFYLSTLNFYVYLQAAAWAPLVVLALRAAEGPAHWCALAALLSPWRCPDRAELVLQSILFGIALAARRREPAGWRRMAGSLILGFGLAAPTLAVMRNAVAGARAERASRPTGGAGALRASPHAPSGARRQSAGETCRTLARPLVGSNFFPLGFPVLSPQLPARPFSRWRSSARFTGARLACDWSLLALLAVVACAGRWGGNGQPWSMPCPAAPLPPPRQALLHRPPGLALLTALGLDTLRSLSAPCPPGAPRRPGSRARRTPGPPGPRCPTSSAGCTLWFLAGCTPLPTPWPDRLWVCDDRLGRCVGGLAAVASASWRCSYAAAGSTGAGRVRFPGVADGRPARTGAGLSSDGDALLPQLSRRR